MAQVVEDLPRKHEALSLNLSTTKKKKKKKKKKNKKKKRTGGEKKTHVHPYEKSTTSRLGKSHLPGLGNKNITTKSN
jgi:hypothetical protein